MTSSIIEILQSVKSRLRSSFIRDAYWAVGHRERLHALRQEVTFYEGSSQDLAGCDSFLTSARTEGLRRTCF